MDTIFESYKQVLSPSRLDEKTFSLDLPGFIWLDYNDATGIIEYTIDPVNDGWDKDFFDYFTDGSNDMVWEDLYIELTKKGYVWMKTTDIIPLWDNWDKQYAETEGGELDDFRVSGEIKLNPKLGKQSTSKSRLKRKAKRLKSMDKKK